MQEYISERKKDVPLAKPKKKKSVKKAEEDFKEEEKEYRKQDKSFFKKILDFIDKPEETMEHSEAEEERELEEDEKELIEEEKELENYSEKKKRKGFLSSLKSWFADDEPKETDAKEEEHKEEGVNEEIKEILRIQNKWLLKLPPKTIKEFKESEDYKRYKEVLIKYRLIKEK